MATASSRSVTLCQICFEEVQHRFEWPAMKTGNGDYIRTENCGHPTCQGCMALHIKARVEELRVADIRCPALGCSSAIFEQDVKRLATAGVLSDEVQARFAELRARDYTTRAKELSSELCKTSSVEEYAVVRQLWESTRLCPRCSVAIQKSKGCNSFYCICGHRFNYDAAPRAVGDGQQHFGRTITLAEHLGISIDEAQMYGERKVYFKAGRLSAAVGVSMELACQLVKRAQSGDEEARQLIRKARSWQRGAQAGQLGRTDLSSVEQSTS